MEILGPDERATSSQVVAIQATGKPIIGTSGSFLVEIADTIMEKPGESGFSIGWRNDFSHIGIIRPT
ncbi:MAG: hypothetical protein LM549_01350, partial [Candidatus Competibacter sp.]|nr:hypothetical protein [Candidatus Competibacter sp.]